MQHTHKNNASGEQLCCTQEEKINNRADADHSSHDGHDHSSDHDGGFRLFIPSLSSLVLMLSALALEHIYEAPWFDGWLAFTFYLVSYAPVGFPVIKDAIQSIRAGEYFSEFMLMSIATIGAFVINEYAEAVAVMLFYAVGEVFQTLAVSRAKSNIKALLDQRPDTVTIVEDNVEKTVPAESVKTGTVIRLAPGEKLALDGTLLSATGSFNTAALTGESVPQDLEKGEDVLAGMINLHQVTKVWVTTPYTDSKLSRILELVQHAAARKAPSELFIRKFAKKYTPIVVALAVAILILPALFLADYQFQDWLYRALVFLVISCPCALVISIPLGYFGGIGAASKNGILFKGSNFLDVLADIDHVVMDKTGTMTKGVFEVQEVVINNRIDSDVLLQQVNALEGQSTHPVATAIRQFVGEVDSSIMLEEVSEIPGHGMRAVIGNTEILVGNFKLMEKYGVSVDVDPASIFHTVIAIARAGQFAGYLTIADTIKEESQSAINALDQLGVDVTMLSGDKRNVVATVAATLGIENAHGELLPEDKVEKVMQIKSQRQTVAFVGDGFNDAPVVALSNAGIAIGGARE